MCVHAHKFVCTCVCMLMFACACECVLGAGGGASQEDDIDTPLRLSPICPLVRLILDREWQGVTKLAFSNLLGIVTKRR